MLFKNPIVYVTIPLAFALGLFWFRRKKIHCDSGGTKSSDSPKSASVVQDVDASPDKVLASNGIRSDLKHSISLPIGSTPTKKNSSPSNNNDSFDFKFGKSAPIDITPNKISPSRAKNVDKEEKSDSRGQELYKELNSIEEHSCDSVDLPGSVNCRRRFSFTHNIKSNEPPVVVKASTMVTNKSPQSSFESTTSSPSTPSSIQKAKDANASKSTKANDNNVTNTSKTNKGNSKNSPKSSKTIKNNKDNSKLPNKADDVSNNKEQQLQVNTSNEEQSATETPTRALPVSSPPLSLCSNKSNQSHDSEDSGKGSSPPNSVGGPTLSSIVSYDFELAQSHVGCVLGKGGAFVSKLKTECGVIVSIKRHPLKQKKFKLCALQGTQSQIDKALEMIKRKLPPRTEMKRFEFDMDSVTIPLMSNIDPSLLQVSYSSGFTFNSYLNFALVSSLQLHLIDGINNDVIISTVINGGHLFLQQSLHPSYPSLNLLQNFMNQSYSSFESPLLPDYKIDTICVGHIDGHWYRLQIVEHIPEDNSCMAKYLDFGGYCNIQTNDLRQIRTDFMTTPFQAIECFLSDIKPKGN